MRRILDIALLLSLLIALTSLSSCGDDDKILGTNTGEEEDMNVWLWAVGADDSLRVYDADSGALHGTWFADGHPLMRQAKAGPDGEPTVWLGSNGGAYGFTQGFHAHGDHADMNVPERIDPIVTGSNNVHQGVHPHGEYVIWANDGDATFTVVDTETEAVRTLHNGSGHSAALLTDEHLIATQMDPGWARIIDFDADTIIAEIPIATGAHGDALLHGHHRDGDIAFIATNDHIEVLDIEDATLEVSIAYPGTGRVNFLYHAGDNTVAFGPRKLESGDADNILLLDMENRTAETVTLSGSTLAWNNGGGNYALSSDGKMVAVTDLQTAKAWLVCIDGENASCYGSVLDLDAPAANMACAVNHAGDHLWLLDKSDGRVYCYHPDEGELHNDWQAHTASEYIFVTDTALDVIKDY
ncbi:MAG: hypothetical protein GY835_27935 [bacterium]|nr:hypothetical protein [bacterium]